MTATFTGNDAWITTLPLAKPPKPELCSPSMKSKPLEKPLPSLADQIIDDEYVHPGYFNVLATLKAKRFQRRNESSPCLIQEPLPAIAKSIVNTPSRKLITPAFSLSSEMLREMRIARQAVVYHSQKISSNSIRAARYATAADTRGYIPVYEYETCGTILMIDIETSYILLTSISKAIAYAQIGSTSKLAKIDIVKQVEQVPELERLCKRVKRGFLAIQGSWVPFRLCFEICRRLGWHIRHELVPLFGQDFPALCISPIDSAFGDLRFLSHQPKRNNFQTHHHHHYSQQFQHQSSQSIHQQQQNLHHNHNQIHQHHHHNRHSQHHQQQQHQHRNTDQSSTISTLSSAARSYLDGGGGSSRLNTSTIRHHPYNRPAAGMTSGALLQQQGIAPKFLPTKVQNNNNKSSSSTTTINLTNEENDKEEKKL